MWPFLAGERPHAEKLGGPSAEYTPALLGANTNPVLGSGGTTDGWAVRVGRGLVAGGVKFVWGGSGRSVGNGAYRITLPPDFPANTSLLWFSTTPGLGALLQGSGYLRDASTGSNNVQVTPYLETETTIRLARNGASTALTHDNEITWDVGDVISASFIYVTDAI